MNSTSSEAGLPREFLAPRYWPQWIALFLLSASCLLPLHWLRAIGRAMGRVFGRLGHSRRHVVETNLRLCFPQLTPEEIDARAKAHFEALGAGIFETAAAWLFSSRRILAVSEVRGLENLQAVQRTGHGVLLLTGHFTTLEFGARILCVNRIDFHAMYRPMQSPLFDYWVRTWRESGSRQTALPKDDLRGIVRALRRGHSIWYGPDQTLETANALFVPFFGVPTLTLTATSRLAEMGRAKVVPFFVERHGRRYILSIQPALEDFPSGDDAADATRVNGIIETAVLRTPAEYFWVHRRFKHRPAGVPDVYARPRAD